MVVQRDIFFKISAMSLTEISQSHIHSRIYSYIQQYCLKLYESLLFFTALASRDERADLGSLLKQYNQLTAILISG
jgi:hypothetical protein